MQILADRPFLSPTPLSFFYSPTSGLESFTPLDEGRKEDSSSFFSSPLVLISLFQFLFSPLYGPPLIWRHDRLIFQVLSCFHPAFLITTSLLSFHHASFHHTIILQNYQNFLQHVAAQIFSFSCYPFLSLIPACLFSWKPCSLLCVFLYFLFASSVLINLFIGMAWRIDSKYEFGYACILLVLSLGQAVVVGLF